MDGYSIQPEQCSILVERARALTEVVTAHFDGEPFVLNPNEQALVPASCGGGWVTGSPPKEFMAAQPSFEEHGGLEV